MIGDARTPPVVLLIDSPGGELSRLAPTLEVEGYAVWQADTGGDARKVLIEGRRAGTEPDIIVIDQTLPDVDGRVLAAVLRATVDMPIVLCGPVGQAASRAVVYHLGVDGYLPSPVDQHELTALVQALLRRARPRPIEETPVATPVTELRVGALTIHERVRSAAIDSQPLSLTPTQYRLLVTLARQPNNLVPLEELTQTVWNCEPDDGTASLIATQMARLRAKLRDGADSPLSIVSVPSRGYRLLAA